MYLAQQSIRCVKVFCIAALRDWCIALSTADNEPFQQLEVEIRRIQNWCDSQWGEKKSLKKMLLWELLFGARVGGGRSLDNANVQWNSSLSNAVRTSSLSQSNRAHIYFLCYPICSKLSSRTPTGCHLFQAGPKTLLFSVAVPKWYVSLRSTF